MKIGARSLYKNLLPNLSLTKINGQNIQILSAIRRKNKTNKQNIGNKKIHQIQMDRNYGTFTFAYLQNTTPSI